MLETHHHLAIVGSFELEFVGRDDRYVKRAVARWARVFFPAAAKKVPSHSIAAFMNANATIQIGRWRIESGVTRTDMPAAIIEHEFPVSADSLAEFSRVWDRVG